MAYMTVQQQMPASAWLLFIAVTVWTIVYDTYYAMVDKNDDIAIGIHSSALWFGQNDWSLNALLSGVFVVLMVAIITRTKDRQACFTAFLNNQWVGVFIFLGILLAYR